MRISLALILSQAYRPFFPLAALATSASVLVWLLGLSGMLPLPPNPTLWHAHEMLFGFATAVILGFVLTAVQNWTGVAAVGPRGLGLLLGLWLAARLLAFWPSVPGQCLSASVDVFVLPMGAVFMGRVLLTTRNYRNLVFLPLLSVLAALNVAFHWALQNGAPAVARELIVVTVWCVAFLMVFMGGRVIPFFSSRRLAYTPAQWPWLNWTSTLSAAGTIICVALDRNALLVACAGLTAISTALRLACWQPWRAVTEPMLWILHLGYGWLALGYAALALSATSSLGLAPTLPLHAVMAGALGCLSIGMMTRVALGHSQRPISANPVVVATFILVVLAGLLRIAAYFDGPFAGLRGLTLSALLWAMAFLFYAVPFAAALWLKRSSTTWQT